MALEAHVEELSAKHRNLDKLIREEESHPAADEIRIHELKRQKLIIKDRLTELQSTQPKSY